MFTVTVTAKEIYEQPVIYNVSFDEKRKETPNQS
jgi:hypothetical protein